jgi:hypothetical protein
MIRSLPAAWVCLLSSACAIAAETPAASPPDTPSAAFGTVKLHIRPGVEISVGDVKVELEKTTLVQLQKTVGGSIAQVGKPGEQTFGLCYLMHVGDRRSLLWIMSEEDMGPEHATDGAMANALPPGDPVPSNCIEVKGATSMKVAGAAIGSPLADLESRLGKGRKQRGGWLGYSYGANAGSSDLSYFLLFTVGEQAGLVTDLFVQQTTGGPGED